MHFAQWVVTRRKALRLSQSECADRAGVSTPVWCEYEKEEKKAQPRRSTVEKIARALEVPIDEAMQEAGYSPHAVTDIPAELESIWRRVPSERQAGFLRAVRSMGDALSV